MKTILIMLLFIYFIGIVFTKNTLSVMFSAKGIWWYKREHIRDTNFKILCPIYNIIFPIYWVIKGIYIK